MKPKKATGAYEFFITLPDRLYPFAAEIEGKRVRGMLAYKKQLDHILEVYGAGKLGYKLMAYRQTCHFLGSILFILAAAILSHVLFGGTTGLYLMLAAAIVAISFQEFYLHPRRYNQTFRKGVLDWIVWTTPIALVIWVSLT